MVQRIELRLNSNRKPNVAKALTTMVFPMLKWTPFDRRDRSLL